MNRYVADVIKSLKDTPDEWTYGITGYRLQHRGRGVEIWIGNGMPGVSISRNDAKLWGSVTLLSVFFLSPNHWALWLAYKRWQKDTYKPLFGDT